MKLRYQRAYYLWNLKIKGYSFQGYMRCGIFYSVPPKYNLRSKLISLTTTFHPLKTPLTPRPPSEYINIKYLFL